MRASKPTGVVFQDCSFGVQRGGGLLEWNFLPILAGHTVEHDPFGKRRRMNEPALPPAGSTGVVSVAFTAVFANLAQLPTDVGLAMVSYTHPPLSLSCSLFLSPPLSLPPFSVSLSLTHTLSHS